MAMFGAGGGGDFDPSDWVDVNIYNEIMNEDDYDDYDDDYGDDYEDEYNEYDDELEDDDELDDDLNDEVKKQHNIINLNDKKLNDEESSIITVCVESKSPDDKTGDKYYTKLLLDKFPELKKEYSLDSWYFLILENKAKENDYDSAIKYFDYLIDNVDYDFVLNADDFLASHLSIEIVFMLIKNAKGKSQQKLADFLVENKKLFDFVFKKYKWDIYRPEWKMGEYIKFFENVNNLEHAKLAYNTFIEYQKKYYTIDALAYFWSRFWGLDFKIKKYREVRNIDFYNFYKEALKQLGEKGNAGLKLLEWTMTEGVARNRKDGVKYF